MSRPKFPLNTTPWKEKVFTCLALALATVTLSFYFFSIYWMSDYPVGSDFAKFYYSSHYFWAGEDIYQEVPLDLFGPLPEPRGNPRDDLHPNLNPPFVTLLLAPAGLMSYPAAYVVWSTLSLFFGILAIHLIRAALFPNLVAYASIGFYILLLAYFPTWISILYGQLSLLLFLLLTLAWLGLRSGHNRKAGIALGLAASIKLFAGLYLLFLLVRRQWQTLAWALGTIAVCFFSGLVLIGPAAHQRYVEVLGKINWYSASWNASFQGFFMRVFGGSENVPLIPSPSTGRIFWGGCALALILGLVFQVKKGDENSSPIHIDKGFGLCSVAMLLLSPLGWMYYFPVLWLAFAIGWKYRAAFGPWISIFLFFSWALSTFPHLLIPAREIEGIWVIFVLSGVYFYGLLLLALAFFIICRADPASLPEPPPRLP